MKEVIDFFRRLHDNNDRAWFDAVSYTHLLPDLPGAVAEVVTPPCGGAAHAGVGQFARVPRVGSGRVDSDPAAESPLFDDVVHDAVGRRGAADISEADEKDIGLHGRKDNENRATRRKFRGVSAGKMCIRDRP